MIRRLRNWWDAYRRGIDIKILWPSCRAQAEGDLDLARAAFYTHTMIDPAWRSLSEEETRKLIQELT